MQKFVRVFFVVLFLMAALAFATTPKEKIILSEGSAPTPWCPYPCGFGGNGGAR